MSAACSTCGWCTRIAEEHLHPRRAIRLRLIQHFDRPAQRLQLRIAAQHRISPGRALNAIQVRVEWQASPLDLGELPLEGLLGIVHKRGFYLIAELEKISQPGMEIIV